MPETMSCQSEDTHRRCLPRFRQSLLPLVIFCCILLILGTNGSQKGKIAPRAKRSPKQNVINTLVLYTFANSDPEYRRNFDYFVEHGLGGTNVQYIFILQQMKGSNFTSMPLLPKNAAYVIHKNECFDWGTFGWALKTGKVFIKRFKYFIFMNSSVRGPFLPAYFTGNQHWTSIFTRRINDIVKYVGSTINCQPVYWRSDPSNEMRQNPHVQSYVVATDRVGLQVLIEDGNVFGCYNNLLDTVWHSEVGASRAILNAGFGLDSLMLKYAGVDWRDTRNWNCNGRQNPYADFAYDGLMMNPLEVLFVKVKRYQLDSDWITSKMADTYDRWQQSKGSDTSVNNNKFDKARFTYFLSKAITMNIMGQECFDVKYYQQQNPDIPIDAANWEHFLNQGQFEGRPYRFSCENQFIFPAQEVLKQASVIAENSVRTAIMRKGSFSK